MSELNDLYATLQKELQIARCYAVREKGLIGPAAAPTTDKAEAIGHLVVALARAGANHLPQVTRLDMIEAIRKLLKDIIDGR